jgi:hypothetical protein
LASERKVSEHFNEFRMTISPARRRRLARLPKLLTAFIASLPDDALARLYNYHGRLWIDSGDCEFRLSFGLPECRGAHDWMYLEPCVGRWVCQDIGIDIMPDHPPEEDPELVDWTPDPEWVRRQLLDSREDLIAEFQIGLEQARDTTEFG